MKTSSFHFDLPEDLIAQYPPESRGESRLLILDRSTGNLEDSMVRDLHTLIDRDTHLVFNNSKVRKARLYAETEHGGQVEFLLIERVSGTVWNAVVSKAKRRKPGTKYRFPGGLHGEITAADNEMRTVCFDREIDDDYLNEFGHMPLPPYIKREDVASDSSRYQTVYAEPSGSAAAPTAGLHFTPELLDKLAAKASGISFVTLHVGLGTFRPIRDENIEDHRMHTEEYEISETTASQLNAARRQGKKILAVGTTTVRTLESAAAETDGKTIPAGRAETSLFIYPGYKFRVVDRMFTNFHTPDSSLIVMVNAFAGMANIKKAYEHAVRSRYRFFSYGDAMYIK